MGGKRALIVDDSKSARLFLARILEKHELAVDSVESAEAAIEYLGAQRPDVIFMDHQMPGMDGLQALQANKNDPRTATIPIMMYTSQEGEVYLGQARALGAVGVLPKQIHPADVSKVLYQLHLVPDRRKAAQTSFVALASGEPSMSGPGPRSDAGMAREPDRPGPREQFAELRRAMLAALDTQTERLQSEMRALLTQSGRVAGPDVVPAAVPPGPERADYHPWLIAGALALAALGLGLWLQSTAALREVREELSGLRAQIAAARPAAAMHGAAPSDAAAAGTGTTVAVTPTTAPPSEAGRGASRSGEAKPLVFPVPYGAEALGGARLDALRQLLYRLRRAGNPATVEVRTFSGRFCLVGDASNGYSIAPEDTPWSRCDVVGSPSEDTPAGARLPLAVANLVGEIRSSTHGAIDVQIGAGDPAVLAMPYPATGPELLAGDWNRAAAANNRLEIRVR